MRKLRIALVILLLLAFMAASHAATASLISQGEMGNIGKSRATMEGIQKKMANSSSDIARQYGLLDAYAKYMARQSMDNATRSISASQSMGSITPPTTAGYGMPLQGIGDAIKALGSIEISIKAPVTIARSINIPRLAIL
ncbi:hypothetical protein [Methanocella conradii]|uniref:hypothetical protein n=1 Tax=Methanocella conradii TaxID=1175444 RepID=UPI00157D7A86|nr:hypothetical protein [Methanocella conradii]